MKTLVKDGLSLYLFEDDKTVVMTEENITIGDPPEFIVGDCNISNTQKYLNVIAPTDWTGSKYMFDGADWMLNPNWIDPVIEEEPLV